MFRKSMFVLLALAPLLLAVPATAQLTPIEGLGKQIFFDKIASPDNQSCADCHAPSVGFTGAIAGVNVHGAVYAGAVPQRFGNRKPPSSAYATLSPIFHYDASEELFVGGNFWDGRATGLNLGNPAADQALGPFLNPVEQNNPNKRAVLQQIATSQYASQWEDVWGEPLGYTDDAEVALNYDRVGLAIAAYEGSSEVNQFSSKFDAYQRGTATLTPLELRGMELFNGVAMCAACHPAPLFTDFTFDNLGVPKNLENPFYGMDQVFLDNGLPINPDGAKWIDPGLGGFLATLPPEFFTNLGLDKDATVAENMGKQKVPTLRNVDKRPGVGLPKAYTHNGVFKTLKDVIHFYNTRDILTWPEPEVADNVNVDELGNLGLSSADEDAIVAFLGTLSDGFRPQGRRPAVIAAAPKAASLEILPATRLAPATRVSYVVSAAGEIRIQAFDVRGRRLATLVNDWRQPGAYVIDWSTSGLASGNYFLQLETGASKVTRRLVLLK
jgi:cytochrome c peroxidase